MTVTAAYRYGIDWRRKGFMCWDARPGDALNLIPSPLTWERVGYAVSGVGTTLIYPIADTSLGTIGAYTGGWSTGTVIDSYYQFAGVNSYVPVFGGLVYSVCAYAKTNGTSSFALQVVDNLGNILGTGATTSITSSGYQQMPLTVTTNLASSGICLRILHKDTTSRVMQLSGFMVVLGSSLPSGYNSGATIDLYDNITSYVQTAKWQLGFNRPFNDMADENTCDFTLLNENRIFSPEYSGSPLYGQNLLARPIEIRADYGVITYKLWRGWTDKVAPQPGLNSSRLATITGSGAKQYLQRNEVEYALAENVTADVVIDDLLDQVKFPKGYANGPWALGVTGNSELGSTTVVRDPVIERSLEVGRTTFPYVGDMWTESKIKARGFQRLEENRKPKTLSIWDAIDSLVKSERGHFYFDRQGHAIFWNRNHLLADVTVDDTLTDAATDCHYSFGEYLVSHTKVTYSPRVVSPSNEILWQLDKVLEVKANTDKTIKARFTDPSNNSKIAAIEVVKPSVEAGSLVRNSSRLTLVTFKANSTSAEMVFHSRRRDSTVSAITIYGRKITAYDQITITEVARGVQFHEGYREFTLDLDLLEDHTAAESIARYESGRRSRATGCIDSFTFIANKDTTNMTRALTRTIGDRLTISESQTGHSGDYFIMGEQHAVTSGNLHSVTWILEPANTSAYWTLARAGYSELGSTTRVAPL